MKKKGFTLIELLAVIVILAIIALIATPQVLNIIQDSKTSSNKISAENYVSSLKTSIMSNRLKTNFKPEICEFENGITTCDGEQINVEFEGNIESAKVIFANGQVIYYIVYFNDGEYAKKGETPSTCFISAVPGEIIDYICDTDTVIFEDNLKLGTVTGIKSFKYNDDKCKANYDLTTCSKIESEIYSLGKSENLSLNEISSFFASMEDKNLKDFLYSSVDMEVETTDNKNVITKIGDKVFKGRNLKIVALNNTIETLGHHAFSNNQISYLVLQDGLINIDFSAFQENHLTKVVIPNTVQTIGNHAFYDNEINYLTLNSNLKKISDAVFQKNQIKKIVIPEGVNEIGVMTFNDNNISELVIPSSLNKIASYPFSNNCLTEDKVINNSNLNLGINFSDQNNCN